jgi:hypothetical protein
MPSHDSALYSDLSLADLLIFKGDLNYRKLLGDLNWPHSHDFKASLRGFQPSNILALRTMVSWKLKIKGLF